MLVYLLVQMNLDNTFDDKHEIVATEVNASPYEFSPAGSTDYWIVLKLHLVCDAEKLPYAQIAENLSCSVESLKSTMHRLKGWYRELLRAEIAQTVSPEEVADELQQLKNVISGIF